MTKSRRLHLLILHDGRKGHISQAEGLGNAISLAVGCSREYLQAAPRWPFAMKLLRFLAERIPALVPGCYNCRKPATIPDLILSYGGKVAPLNIALARLYSAQNINIGSLRNLNPKNFSAVISISGLPGVPNSIATGQAFTRVNDAAMHAARSEYRQDVPLWLLLFGGNGAGFTYSDEDVMQLAGQLNQLAVRHRIRWLLSTSPRTGQRAEELLRREIHPEVLTDAIWYSLDPDRDLLPMLAAASRVFCSADSSTMIHESLASGKPVTGWFGQKKPEDGKSGDEFERLIALAGGRGFTLTSIEKMHESPLPEAEEHKGPGETVIQQLQQLGVLPASA